MVENNSKHVIIMNLGSYKLYVKEYKLSRSANMSEVSAFMNKREICYMGYEHLRLKATALIDKSRLGEIAATLSGFMTANAYSVTIDGASFGNFILYDYEICGTEDDYIYKVSLSLRHAQ